MPAARSQLKAASTGLATNAERKRFSTNYPLISQGFNPPQPLIV